MLHIYIKNKAKLLDIIINIHEYYFKNSGRRGSVRLRDLGVYSRDDSGGTGEVDPMTQSMVEPTSPRPAPLSRVPSAPGSLRLVLYVTSIPYILSICINIISHVVSYFLQKINIRRLLLTILNTQLNISTNVIFLHIIIYTVRSTSRGRTDVRCRWLHRCGLRIILALNFFPSEQYEKFKNLTSRQPRFVDRTVLY